MAEGGSDPHNAAALRALQNVLSQASQEAWSTQAMLQDATVTFNEVSGRVINVVGGSTQQVDQQVVGALEEAVHYTRMAIAALQAASASARTVR